jgi:hypothetical protein
VWSELGHLKTREVGEVLEHAVRLPFPLPFPFGSRVRGAGAFACKGRGFCPSCLGRRMCATAANLIEDVLPEDTRRGGRGR